MRGPYAVLTPCGQSHPFDERKVKVGPEEDPLKIGRAVARLKPAAENAIFDCKVLSRNHAVLYYDEGAFFLKDTKSSNGTFVNNDRLAGTGEESEPRQIFSGDILQFGVEIVESSNKVVSAEHAVSVAHGCIFTMVALFDDKGKEAKKTDVSPMLLTAKRDDNSYGHSFIAAHQLFQLQQYIKEALFREKMREQKMQTLESLLSTTAEANESAFKAGVNEDRLLARIESLEATLALYSKNATPEKLREELERMKEQQENIECIAKENVKRAQEERSEALLGLADAKKCLLSTEEECTHLRHRVEDLEKMLATTVEECEKHAASTAMAERLLEETEQRADNAERSNQELSDRSRIQQSPDELISNTLLLLAYKLPTEKEVDRSLISSLHDVTGQILKTDKGKESEDDVPPVPQPNGGIDEDSPRKKDVELIRTQNELAILQKRIDSVLQDKMNLQSELEELRALTSARIISLTEDAARNAERAHRQDLPSDASPRLEMVMQSSESFGNPDEVAQVARRELWHTYLPSVLLLSLVPTIGIILLLLFPIFVRLPFSRA